LHPQLPAEQWSGTVCSEILDARFQQTVDYDVLGIYTFNTVWKIPANFEVS
jgi:hypothetical protein